MSGAGGVRSARAVLAASFPIMPPVERAGRRRLRAWWLVALALALSQADAGESDPAPAAPWQTNRPIVRVKKELYKPHPRPRAAMLVSVQYVGPRLERRE